jgi:hypothetical protein
MKTLIPEIISEQTTLAARINVVNKMVELLAGLEFDEAVHCNPMGGSCWIYVYNRDDLKTALSLAKGGQTWRKSIESGSIRYISTIDSIDFSIFAHDAALPPTCKVVEEEYFIEAQPARIGKRSVVKCNETLSPAVAAPSDTSESTSLES